MRWILLIKLNIRIYVPKYHLCELEEPGGLQSMELQRVRYHWASSQSFWGEETVPAKLRCSSKALELLMAGLPGLLILASLTRYTCENLESKICLRWLSGKESLPASSIPGLGGSHRAPEQLSSCATTTTHYHQYPLLQQTPSTLEPVLHNKRSHHSDKLTHHNCRVPPARCNYRKKM